jgi:hypothetical protein
MKRIPTIMFPEILDSLESLSNEEIGQMIRLVIKWNKGEVVEPQSSLEKFVWATMLPKLERDKDRYEEVSEKRRDAVNKRWSKQKDTNEYKSIEKNTNYNYNLNNISNDILFEDNKQPKSSEDDSVVSKGLETLEQTFPERKRAIGIDEINLWNSISQPQKSNLIKMAKVYIRNEEKKENGKFIKQLSKWMKEQIELGIPEEIKKPVKKEKRLFEMTNAVVWDRINKFGFTNNQTDLIYQILNTSLDSKEEFVTLIKTSNKEDLESLIK